MLKLNTIFNSNKGSAFGKQEPLLYNQPKPYYINEIDGFLFLLILFFFMPWLFNHYWILCFKTAPTNAGQLSGKV
jgi:hypothetical protein